MAEPTTTGLSSQAAEQVVRIDGIQNQLRVVPPVLQEEFRFVCLVIYPEISKECD